MKRVLRSPYVQALAIRMLGAALMFGMNAALARLAGAEAYGIFAIAMAWSLVAMTAGALGLNTAALRIVAQTEAQPETRAGFLAWAGRRAVLGAGLAGLAVAGMGALAGWRGWLPAEAAQGLMLAGPLAAALPLVEVVNGIQRGAGALIRALAPYNLAFPLLVTGLALAFRPGALGLVGIAGAAAWAALALSLWLARRIPPKARPEQSARPAWSALAWAALPTGLSNHAGRQLDAILLAFLVSPAAVGAYWLASRLVRVASFGLQAAQMVASPDFARLHAEAGGKGDPKLQAAATRAVRATLAMALPMALALGLLAGPLLGLVSPAFRDAAPIVHMLLLGQVVSIACGPNAALLNMAGQAGLVARLSVVGLILQGVLLVPLAWAYGGLGAAAAAALVTLLRNLALSWAAWRRLGVDTTVLALVRGRSRS